MRKALPVKPPFSKDITTVIYHTQNKQPFKNLAISILSLRNQMCCSQLK